MSHPEVQPEPSSTPQSDVTPETLSPEIEVSRFQRFDEWIANGAPPISEGLEGDDARLAAKDFMVSWFNTIRWGDKTRLGRRYVQTVSEEIHRLIKTFPGLIEEIGKEAQAQREREFAELMARKGKAWTGTRWEKPKKSP